MTTDSSAAPGELRAAWPATIRAEWTKLRTLPSTAWLLTGAAALTIAVSAIVAATTHVTSTRSAGSGGQDPTKLALTGIDLGQAVIVVLAVLTVCEEYGTGMIRVTLAAIPRRPAVLAAKAVNLVGLALVAGLVAVAGCLIAGRMTPPGAGLGPAHGYSLVSLAHPATLRAATGSVIYLVLIALLALGVATAVRDTAVSVGAVLGLLYGPPLLAQAVSDPLRRHIQQIAPMTAGLAIQATTNLRNLPIAPWAGLGVLAAWAAASLLVGGALLRRRDA
ncbi:MAG: ABC transporter permease [Solirubrobacteraceae bacterium]